MSGIDEVVTRLADITDELLALGQEDFAARFKLETERDGLRDQAAEFHQPKDEGTPTEQLLAELAARRKQLHATQASSDFGRGCIEHPLGTDNNGTMYMARMSAQGAPSIVARIAELEQALARR
jgi:hypothetical protein